MREYGYMGVWVYGCGCVRISVCVCVCVRVCAFVTVDENVSVGPWGLHSDQENRKVKNNKKRG